MVKLLYFVSVVHYQLIKQNRYHFSSSRIKLLHLMYWYYILYDNRQDMMQK